MKKMKLKCPEQPEKLIGQPIGQYHCPYCGMMVMAGAEHPDLVLHIGDDRIDLFRKHMMRDANIGWYAVMPDYDHLGPYDTEDEAITVWVKEMKARYGVEWEVDEEEA